MNESSARSQTYETKAISTPEIADAFEGFMRAFEEFKSTNDERLRGLERRSSGDVVTEEKLSRIDDAVTNQKRLLDELLLRASRPARSGTPVGDAAGHEHKAAFETYVRRGDATRIAALEQKALSAGSGSDGGYLVPSETEATILAAVRQISPIRAISGNRQVTASLYKKPFSLSGAGTGWVGESDARPQTASPTLAELSFPTMELYAMPAATQMLIDDSAVDIDQWVAEEVRVAFAEQEGSAFITGDGLNKPRGFLDYDTVAENAWVWGKLGYEVTGAAGALAASDPEYALIDLVYALKSGYRANAHWVMNRATQSALRKIKDADGHYIWQPPAQPGAGATLLGFPVMEAEDMPDIAADSMAIAFGDFQRGYLVVDRIGIRVLRDPYSSKPYVLFYTTKRVGGGVQDFDAIKLLKFGTA